MFARFVNPHLKESNEQYVSRQEIQEEWGLASPNVPEENLERKIDALLEKAITNREWDLSTIAELPRKRRKLAPEDTNLPHEDKGAEYCAFCY